MCPLCSMLGLDNGKFRVRTFSNKKTTNPKLVIVKKNFFFYYIKHTKSVESIFDNIYYQRENFTH